MTEINLPPIPPDTPTNTTEEIRSQYKKMIEIFKLLKSENIKFEENTLKNIDENILYIESFIFNILDKKKNKKKYNNKDILSLMSVFNMVKLKRQTYDVISKIEELYEKNNQLKTLIEENEMKSNSLQEKIKEADEESKTLITNINDIEKRQRKAEQQSSNLVYNILGFIASFSVVSAAVASFEKVNGIEDIIVFMAFTTLILITTLIGLNNFYNLDEAEDKVKETNEKKLKLRDNYFLWKALCIILILTVILALMYKGVTFIKENIETISEGIGKGIETVRQEYSERLQNEK